MNAYLASSARDCCGSAMHFFIGAWKVVNRNPKSERNIKRIDKVKVGGRGETHGFQVYFRRQGVEFTKFFSDLKCGGEQKALLAAREFRDKAGDAIPAKSDRRAPVRATQNRNKSNKTGHVGLHFQDKRLANGGITRYLVAVASPEPMKQVQKSFRIGDRSVDEVISEALAWRREIVDSRIHRESQDQQAWNDAIAELLARGQRNLNNTQRLKVFLCHARDDKEQVRKLYLRLLDLGCQPWLDDESLLPGQNWDSEIRKAIRSSHVFLACLSARSVTKRGYVQREIKFALDVAEEIPEGSIFVIPIKLEPCDAPESLSRWHWIEAYKDGYGRLIASLAQQTLQLGLEPLRGDFG